MSPRDEPALAPDDAALPGWWLMLFGTGLALAGFYWLWHAAFAISPGPLDRYVAERAAALDTGFAATDDALAALAGDELSVRAGGQIFAQHCARCHGARAQGEVGPNLTDAHWLAGGSPGAIYAAIVDGRVAGGMQPWGGQLGPARCKQVAAYLLTLRNTDQPGKPPQGARWEPPAGAAASPTGPESP